MRIAFVDINDPRDPKAWSGIPFRMLEGFSRRAEIEIVGGTNRGLRQLYMGHKVISRLIGARFDEQRTALSTRLLAYRLQKALAGSHVEAVVAPSSLPISLFRSRVPVAFWTDACFGAMTAYYDDFANLCRRSMRDGQVQERTALAHCRLAIYASDWAADLCCRLYPEHRDKVRVVPFGANLDPEYDEQTVSQLLDARTGNECRLLFVGVDWKRKGGDVALDAARIMNEKGLPTTLTIVGCTPFAGKSVPRFVNVAGFIERRCEAGLKRLTQLFAESHFLVLPSRAEAFGIVLCEAAAFAVPAIASNTGGIPTIVEDGVTGRLLPTDADGEQYANALTEVFCDQKAYRRFARSAFDKYQQKLNWNSACKSVLSELSRVSAPKPAH